MTNGSITSTIKVHLSDAIDDQSDCTLYCYFLEHLPDGHMADQIEYHPDDCYLKLLFDQNQDMVEFLKNINSTRDSMTEQLHGVEFQLDVELHDVQQPDDVKDQSVDLTINELMNQVQSLQRQIKIQSDFNMFIAEILENAGYLQRETYSKDSLNLH